MEQLSEDCFGNSGIDFSLDGKKGKVFSFFFAYEVKQKYPDMYDQLSHAHIYMYEPTSDSGHVCLFGMIVIYMFSILAYI